MWQEAQANSTSGDGEVGTLLTCRSSCWGAIRTWGWCWELLSCSGKANVVQRWDWRWGRDLRLKYLRHKSESAALGPAPSSMDILC